MISSDRQRGALFGLAIGDALGAAVEFEPPGTFPEVTGYRGGGPHRLAPGEWTDDSAPDVSGQSSQEKRPTQKTLLTMLKDRGCLVSHCA